MQQKTSPQPILTYQKHYFNVLFKDKYRNRISQTGKVAVNMYFWPLEINKVRITTTIIFLILSSIIFAQNIPEADTAHIHHSESDTLLIKADTIPPEPQITYTYKDSLQVYWFYLDSYADENPELQKLDTSSLYSQQTDPAFSGNNFYQTLGNQGLAAKNMLYEAPDPIKFNYSPSVFSHYTTTPEDLKAFHTLKPYSILDYTQGPTGEQRLAQLNVDHGQYLGKNLGVGTKIYMNSSQGDYSRQKAMNYQVAFFGFFKTNSERYGVNASYIHNDVECNDNGGILYDSIFEQNLESNRKLFLVNRDDAESKINDSRVNVSQYFYLLNPQKHNISLGKIGLKSTWERQKYMYTDTDPSTAYYPAFYGPDSTNTFDSTTVIKITNNLYWASAKAGKRQLLNIKGGVMVQNNSIRNYDTIINPVHYFTTYGKLSINPDSITRIRAKAALTTGTHGAENFLLEGDVFRDFSFGTVTADIKLYNTDPGYQYMHYLSSHYTWDSTSFKDEVLIQAGILYQNRKFEAGIRYNSVINHTYYNELSLPEQSPGAVHLLRGWLYHDITFGKFDISAKAAYQYISDKEVIRLPDFMGKLSFQFYQPMFDRALFARIGFDVLYTTSYYADNYNPAIRSFYHQDDKKTGNYPYIDAYIKLQVKRARIFLMFTHANSGLMGYDYYLTPHYPMKDRYFKYGVSWYFHD